MKRAIEIVLSKPSWKERERDDLRERTMRSALYALSFSVLDDAFVMQVVLVDAKTGQMRTDNGPPAPIRSRARRKILLCDEPYARVSRWSPPLDSTLDLPTFPRFFRLFSISVRCIGGNSIPSASSWEEASIVQLPSLQGWEQLNRYVRVSYLRMYISFHVRVHRCPN